MGSSTRNERHFIVQDEPCALVDLPGWMELKEEVRAVSRTTKKRVRHALNGGCTEAEWPQPRREGSQP